MTAEKMTGLWKLQSSENFDEYMKALGVGLAIRMMGNMSKPTITLTIDGNAFSYKSVSTFRTKTLDCIIGEEFDEVTPDGHKCKTILKWKDDKLVQVQKWDGKQTTISRYMNDAEELVTDCEINGIVCTRVYTKV